MQKVHIEGHGGFYTPTWGRGKGKQGQFHVCLFPDGTKQDVWIVEPQIAEGAEVELDIEVAQNKAGDKTYRNVFSHSSPSAEQAPGAERTASPPSGVELKSLARLVQWAHIKAKKCAADLPKDCLKDAKAVSDYMQTIFGTLVIAATSSQYAPAIKRYLATLGKPKPESKPKPQPEEEPEQRHYEELPEDPDIPF